LANIGYHWVDIAALFFEMVDNCLRYQLSRLVAVGGYP
jgi:hypothetical protein